MQENRAAIVEELEQAVAAGRDSYAFELARRLAGIGRGPRKRLYGLPTVRKPKQQLLEALSLHSSVGGMGAKEIDYEEIKRKHLADFEMGPIHEGIDEEAEDMMNDIKKLVKKGNPRRAFPDHSAPRGDLAAGPDAGEEPGAEVGPRGKRST